MMRSISTGKLLWFPLSTPVPEAAAQNWNLRILETRDNLENALDYLRDGYNAMLAGEPITAADEILARVERCPGAQLFRKSGSMSQPRETQNKSPAALCCGRKRRSKSIRRLKFVCLRQG